MKTTHYIDKDTPEIEDFQNASWFISSRLNIKSIWDMNLVIPVPADVLAPKGARPSAGTVLTGLFSQILLRILNNFSLITGRYSMKSHKVSWDRVNEDDDLRFHPHGNIMIHHTVSLYVIHVIEISTTTGGKTYHELLAHRWYHITMTSDDEKDISNHLKLHSLVKILFRLTKRNHQRQISLALCEGNPPVTWIPCTNGQWCGKCFHVMMSSCTQSRRARGMLCLQIPCLWSENIMSMSPGGDCWVYYSGNQWGSQKSLQPISRPGIQKLNLWVRDLKMCCRDSTPRWVTSIIVPVMATRMICPIKFDGHIAPWPASPIYINKPQTW